MSTPANYQNGHGGQLRTESRTGATVKKRDNMFHFRTASPGYWTLTLLPLAIYFADGNEKFRGQSFTAVIIIVYNSILMFLFRLVNMNLFDVLERLKILNTVLFTFPLLYSYYNEGIFYEYLSYAVLNFSFPYIFKNIIQHYPRSFSFGEGVIVSSAFVYNFWVASQNLVMNPLPDIQKATEPILLTLLIEMAFFGTMLLSRGVLFVSKPTRFFILQEGFCLWAKVGFAAFAMKLQSPVDDCQFLVFWTLEFLLGNLHRVLYLVYWTILVSLALFYVWSSAGTTTVDRKFFHLLISAVFFPAIINDFNFIFFCSAIVLFGFIFLEAVRVLRFAIFGIPFGEMIDGIVSRFRDDRDAGPLILTPIYLLVGCAAPIWLTGLYYESTGNFDLSPEEHAAALTGVLSVGIGDTVASVVGSMFGQIHWPGSRKTVEGTVCSIFAQIFTVMLCCLTGWLPYTTLSVTALCICAVINGLVEALTSQIDNLVVPLVAFNTVHIVIWIHDLWLVT